MYKFLIFYYNCIRLDYDHAIFQTIESTLIFNVQGDENTVTQEASLTKHKLHLSWRYLVQERSDIGAQGDK